MNNINLKIGPWFVRQDKDDLDCLKWRHHHIALKTLSTGKSIVVIYSEVSSEDGFVITAFITSKKTQFERRVRLWPL